MAKTNLKFQQLVFNLANQKVNEVQAELQKLAKDAFGNATQAFIVQFSNAKELPHMNKSINHVNLENSTIEQIVKYYLNELEL